MQSCNFAERIRFSWLSFGWWWCWWQSDDDDDDNDDDDDYDEFGTEDFDQDTTLQAIGQDIEQQRPKDQNLSIVRHNNGIPVHCMHIMRKGVEMFWRTTNTACIFFKSSILMMIVVKIVRHNNGIPVHCMHIMPAVGMV